MRAFLLGLLAVLFMSSAATTAEARRGGGSTSEELLFVSPTDLGSADSPIALCHLVSTTSVIFVNFWRTVESYALAENGCATDSYFEFDATQLKAAQTAGLVPADIPVTPKLSIGQIAGGFWGFGILAALLIFAVAKMAKARTRRKERRGLMGEGSPASHAILDAMCHAAKADGQIDPSEIATIKSVAEEMTGQAFSPEIVKRMADLAEATPAEADFKRLVKGRSKDEQLDMMRGVLMVVAADGQFAGKEQVFVGGLAKAMRMNGDVVKTLLSEVVSQQAPA
ncbi:DUF533 domain-containing protein [Yoonia maritima]|uniref:tellurite resistance TerB family protein n=1 Tax=Yoonia maritima TaxID=1435347 RepID=UPI0037352D48